MESFQRKSHMRKKEKEITDIASIESIINSCLVCRLALCDEDQPYIVPLNFGYKDGTLYFHSALEGKKIDLLNKNNKVCFEFDTDLKLENGDKACSWTANYKSVIGFGKATFIEDSESKIDGLNIIMSQYSDKSFNYPDTVVNKTAIFKVEIDSMTGKKSGY